MTARPAAYAGVPTSVRPWRRVWRAATSTGPGYERQPPNPRADFSSVRGYPIDYRTKTESSLATGRRLLPMTVAQVALGWWERSLAGEAGALAEFRRLCRRLELDAEPEGAGVRWWVRIPVPKYRIAEPHCTAMVQGQIASVFVRSYVADGEPAHAELALGAIEPLVRARGSELVTWTESGPILEEAPSSPPSHILNGWVFALWGLWDVAVGLEDPGARDLFEASVDCLRRRIDSYDTGWWTRYSVYPHAVQDVAKPFYHRLHVDQAELCHRLTGFDELAAAARRWRAYDRPVNLVRALGHKATFGAPRLLDR